MKRVNIFISNIYIVILIEQSKHKYIFRYRNYLHNISSMQLISILIQNPSIRKQLNTVIINNQKYSDNFAEILNRSINSNYRKLQKQRKMNAFDLLFGPIGPALKYIFTIGYIPNRDDFLELTEEQYVAFVKQCGETNEKIFMFSPQNPNLTMDAYNEVSCISESEIQGFQDAANLIQQYCNQENKTFDSMEKKLRFMASRLPDVFSKGTVYEKYHHLSID